MNSAPSESHSLQCMEIWGGNKIVSQFASTPGLDIWVSSRPYGSTSHGGDVYYVSLCGGGSITRFILADVSGHGDAVASVARSLRDLMRRNINQKDQRRLVQSLNQEFSELAKMNRFATAVVATYLTSGDTLTICNAGHPRPLWRPANSNSWMALDQTITTDENLSDLPLGIVTDMVYTQYQISLGREDLLLFYTDALIECENLTGEQLGEAGLIAILNQIGSEDPKRIPKVLSTILAEYREGAPDGDDATFVLLRHTGDPRRRPGFQETLSVYAKVLGLKSV